MESRCIFIFLFSSSIFISLFRISNAHVIKSNSTTIALSSPNTNKIKLNGIYRNVNNQTEYVYQLPTTTSSPPNAIFILLHGCSHSGTDFFPKSSTCEQCIGLPIEIRITKEVLHRNMIPLAISSANRETKCWGPQDDFNDLSNVIVDFIKEYVPTNLAIPVYYFGASSGGTYAGMLAQYGKQNNLVVAGAIVEIAATRLIPSFHIPTMVFIYMSRDQHSSVSVQKLMTTLKSKNSPHLAFAVNEKKITKDFFTFEHVLSHEDSTLLVSALVKGGYLTKEGYLNNDPRSSHWREVIVCVCVFM